jgi:nucleotide-binding universal stress UspA family protein
MKNILVGIDFHDKTQLLIDKACELSKKYNAKIWLLHAAAPEPDFVGYEVGPKYIREFRALELKKEHKLLTEYTDQLKRKKVKADGLLIPGSTIDVIMEESEKLKIDLIIIGRHKHSFMYNIFFDNHTSEIIKNSDIPVLVIPLGK